MAAYKVTATGAFGGTASTSFTDANANINVPGGPADSDLRDTISGRGTSFDFAVTYREEHPRAETTQN